MKLREHPPQRHAQPGLAAWETSPFLGAKRWPWMIKPPGKPGIAAYLSTKRTKKDTYGWKAKAPNRDSVVGKGLGRFSPNGIRKTVLIRFGQFHGWWVGGSFSFILFKNRFKSSIGCHGKWRQKQQIRQAVSPTAEGTIV